MSKTEGIVKLYYELKKVDWRSARLYMPLEMSITGYFCGLSENPELEKVITKVFRETSEIE